MSPRPNPILKVILLGDSGVGKSSIINRYVNDRFVENNMQTIGVDLFTKVATVGESCVTLQIWDTGGQERFRALRTPFYRGADCAILVYGKDNPKSILNLSHWRSEFIKHAGNAPVLIARNKTEISMPSTSDEGVNMATDNNYQHFNVSAKTADGIESLFQAAAQLGVPTAIERLEESLQQSSVSNLVSLQQRQSQRKPCCWTAHYTLYLYKFAHLQDAGLQSFQTCLDPAQASKKCLCLPFFFHFELLSVL